MSMNYVVGDDALTDNGKGGTSKLDLPLAREQLKGLAAGKSRRMNVPTGEIIDPVISEKTGKITNKARVGRGTVEYPMYLALDAVGKEDVEGRKLNIEVTRLGVDNNQQSPTFGQDITQFRVWWGDKRDMTPAARTGLNRRILQTQTASLAKAQQALNASKTPTTEAEYNLAFAKLEYTKARIRSEYRPDNADLATAAEEAKDSILLAEQMVKEAKSVPSGAPDDIDKLLLELQSDPTPEPAPAPAPTPAKAQAPAKPAAAKQ